MGSELRDRKYGKIVLAAEITEIRIKGGADAVFLNLLGSVTGFLFNSPTSENVLPALAEQLLGR